MAKYFKPYTGFTQKKMGEIYDTYQRLKWKRKNYFDYNYFQKYYLDNPNRIYPMSKQKYNSFAERLWKKRGSLKFGKRKITGVIFGLPRTETIYNHHYRVDTIKSRFIGCQIDERKLVLSIED
jgi:hypothetical protein